MLVLEYSAWRYPPEPNPKDKSGECPHCKTAHHHGKDEGFRAQACACASLEGYECDNQVCDQCTECEKCKQRACSDCMGYTRFGGMLWRLCCICLADHVAEVNAGAEKAAKAVKDSMRGAA